MHPIKFYRQAKGWTQGGLAKELNVNINSVVAWEKGTTPRPQMLLMLSKALGVEPLELLREIEHWKATGGNLAA